MDRSSAELFIRPYTNADESPVLALIEADRLPGQPMITARALVETLNGQTAVRPRWWAQLTDLHTELVVSPDDSGDTVAGVVSYARWRGDFAGVLLWLHAREQPRPVTTLVEHVLRRLSDCRQLYAFDLATAFTPHHGALPVRHRLVTASALRAAGFTATDAWCYRHCTVSPTGANERPSAESPPAGICLARHASVGGWTISAHHQHDVLAQLLLTGPTRGVTELRWGQAPGPGQRGRLITRAALSTALNHCHQAGAAHAVLHVPVRGDHHDEDRETARMYDALGFTEIDRLAYFTRPMPDLQKSNSPAKPPRR